MSLHQDPTQTAVRRQKRSLWTDAWRRMRRSHTAVIGMILFALIVIVCFSAPLFSDYDAQVINSDIALIRKYPVEGHPLGTDELGRDLLLRILWGGRTSITIALAATVVSSVLGIILGAIPAYYGGATDSIIMRTLDVFMAIPSMLLMITLVNIMKPTTFNLIIAMSISGVPSIARIVRGQMLSVMRNEYVEAVRGMGASGVRIVVKHVLPNAISPLIAQIVSSVAGEITMISTLSYIGLGVQQPAPEWGSMLAAGQQFMGLVACPPGRIERGSIVFDGQDLSRLSKHEYRKLRGKEISMIFQDPMTALNPTMTVADQIAEAIRNHKRISKHAAKLEAIRMLETVRIPAERAFEYPHQFSGGMKQRVVIAMALACNPKLLIADEPTTALDVTIQAQVLELMKDLKEKYDTSMIMITHDLGIVSEVCDKVAIIYAGEVVEYGSLEHIYRNPQHPYTNGLFGSLPDISKDVEFLSPIEGLMPDPAALPSGCKFNPRCKYACPLCAERAPVLTETEPGHFVRCLIYENALDVKEVVKYE